MRSRQQQGKVNRRKGSEFELFVRKDLVSKGWTINKWNNDVDLLESEVIQAKKSFNPFTKRLGYQNGFPDLVAFRLLENGSYDVQGVEVKSNGRLDAVEKAKAEFYLDKKVFSRFLVASRVKLEGRYTALYRDFFKTGKEVEK